MYEKRGLPTDRANSIIKYLSLFDFFEKTGLGTFIMVFENKLPIGGICCVIQGHTMRYLEGYSHPDFRQYPITHIAFFEAIKFAKQKGLRFFDLGGYANNVQEGDQLYAINKFKEGFRGQIITYPETLLIYTLFLSKQIFQLYKKARS
jgi:lipid II:glycine glycyltransferase (peptidoglycan interpeptide bridge formation enzyme)